MLTSFVGDVSDDLRCLQPLLRQCLKLGICAEVVKQMTRDNEAQLGMLNSLRMLLIQKRCVLRAREAPVRS
jgi:hypothetical protein